MMPSPQMLRVVPRLPPRQRDGHKGTFGRVVVVAGSAGMSGAAALAGVAALRGGAGLVQVAVPATVAGIVASHQPCYMVSAMPADGDGLLAHGALAPVLKLIEGASAVVAGPGLGRSDAIAAIVRGLCEHAACPLLLDADALNVLGPWPGAWRDRKASTVVTPHPGEFARLTGSRPATEQRVDRAIEFARREGGVLLLKGAGTVVTDGAQAFVNSTGNPGMATGGSGDVLSGLLGALLCRLPAFEAACLGAHLHGRAGDVAAARLGEESLIATDLIEALPEAFRGGNGTEIVPE